MNALSKHTGYLLLMYIIFAIAGFVMDRYFALGVEFKQTALLLTGGLIISFIVSAVFYSGFSKSEATRVQRTLLAVGLKFFLYALLAGVSVLCFKKLTMPFMLTFFVIYLAFTIFLILNFVHVLKSKKV